MPEEEKTELRQRTNSRISQQCNYASLIIILITIASFIIGVADTFFVHLGIMISIALLAIAAINNPIQKG